MSDAKSEKRNVVFFGYREWAASIAKQLVDASFYSNCGWRLAQYWVESHDGIGQRRPFWPGNDPVSGDKRESLKIKQNPSKFYPEIQAVNPLAILAYGWSQIIPETILQIAPVIILHPSPLPKYRGGSPIQHQIMAGETKSAVSLLWATNEVDAGPILAQKPFSLDGSLDEIFERITKIGVELTLPILDLLASGCILAGTPQDATAATTFKRRTPAESAIAPNDIANMTARQLCDKVRCLQPPYPGAFIRGSDGKRLIIEKARVAD